MPGAYDARAIVHVRAVRPQDAEALHWFDDRATQAVALYLGKPRRFVWVARMVAGASRSWPCQPACPAAGAASTSDRAR